MFYDASGEQIDFPSYEPYHKTDSYPYQKPQSQQKSKKCVQIIVVIIIILIIIVGIFLAIFFSLKRKEDGGRIYFIFLAEKSGNNPYKLFNKIKDLKEGDYEIIPINVTNSRRLLDVPINNNRRLDQNEVNLVQGEYNYSIKFKKIIKSLEGMFENIQELKSVDFSKFKSKKVVNMNKIFYNCTNLEEINFKNFNAEKLVSMDNSFEGCSNLTNLDLSSFSTPKLNSMTSAFKNCSNLLSLNIKNFIFDSNFNMSNIYEGCDSLINIEVPDNNQKILNYQKNITAIQCKEGEFWCKQCESTNIANTNINFSICIECYDSFFVPTSIPHPTKCNKCIYNCKKCQNELTCDECYENYHLSNGNVSCEQNLIIDTTIGNTNNKPTDI